VHDLTVSVADIVGSPGRHRDLVVEAELPEVANALVRVGDEPVRARVRLESVVEGVLVTGAVEGTPIVECARCLERRAAPLSLELCELCVPGGRADDDTYRIVDDAIDLRSILVDAVALGLPLRPLCRPDCKGLCDTCGRNLNDGPCHCERASVDPRWAPLEALRARLEAN
jgi:uncharacterized protein